MQMFQRSIRAVQFFAYPLLVAAGVLFAPQPAGALTSYWILQDANGNWNNDANWNNGIPKNPGDIAIITNNFVQLVSKTITIDTAVSLKALKFAMPNAASNGYNVVAGTGGSLTMDSGDGSHSAIQQLSGSGRCKVTIPVTLSNDVDIINSVGASTYFDVSCPISGNYNIHINPDGSTAQPYLTVANTFVGNTTVYAGKLLFSADCFGNTTNGTRIINLVSNSYLRINNGVGTYSIATNRQIVTGFGGGSLDGNTRLLLLPGANQLSGSNTFTLISQNAAIGGLQLNAANDNFCAPLVVNAQQILRLSTNGTINSSPMILLTNATASLDVLAKPSGYFVPPNQILAGIGLVSGLVSVASAAATIHPGNCAPPSTTTTPGIMTLSSGGLSITNGGTYAWDLAQLKDNAYAPGTTTYSQLAVSDGSVNLTGGKLAVSFVSGIATPASTNAFWKTNHVWTVLTAAAAPVGTLAVTNGPYTGWAFTTRASSNTLELVYGSYTPPPKGTLMTIH